MKAAEIEQIIASFPFLVADRAMLASELAEVASLVEVESGGFICMEGNKCGHLPLVMSGTARVYKQDEEGREITLYRIEAGDSCILTASCMLSDRSFPAFAAAETDVTAVAVPLTAFKDWMNRHEAWRHYVFELIATRLATVMEMVQEVAFNRLDVRLASYLMQAAGEANDVVPRTHEQIAADLGTSREVVSRILKDFERKGYVALMRGAIHVQSPSDLQQKAAFLPAV